MKVIHNKSNLWLLLVVPALLFLLSVSVVEAQRNGSQVGADQDRLQDGSGAGMQQGYGDGTGDQARLQDGSGDNCLDGDCDGDPDQDRDRIQDRTNMPEGADPVEAQNQQQLRLYTPSDLEQYVQEQNRVRAQEKDGAGSQVQTRTEARVAADAVEAAEPMLGQNGPRMSEMAREMNQAYNGMAANEEALQNRSRLQLFLFGQDDEIVAAMQQEMEQNQNRIQQLKQYMLDCEDCDQGATEMLVTQIQNMEKEQNRLQDVVEDAAGRQGLFGFLFGWMR